MRSVRSIVRGGIADLGAEDVYVRLVSHYEGWTGSLRNRRVRVMQALSDHHERHFDVVWALLAVQLFTFQDREDLADAIVGAFHDAKFRGRIDRENDEPPRTMIHRVSPPAARGWKRGAKCS